MYADERETLRTGVHNLYLLQGSHRLHYLKMLQFCTQSFDYSSFKGSPVRIDVIDGGSTIWDSLYNPEQSDTARASCPGGLI